MIERRIRRRTIVAPDGDPQSTGFNELNRIVEPNHVVWRTSLRFVSRCRLAFVLVCEACDFDIAEFEMAHETFENHQSFRALDSIVVEMSVGGENDIDPSSRKLT